MKTLALIASTAFCLALLVCQGQAFAEGDEPYIEVHRMGQAFGPGGPMDIAPDDGYGLLERARISERVTIDDWDKVIPPDQGDPDEDPADDDGGILDDSEEGSSGGGLVYPDPFGGGGSGGGTWVAPTPGAGIPEPATLTLMGLGFGALLLGLRKR